MLFPEVSQPLARDLTIAVIDINQSAFCLLSLFTNGEQAAWYDPSDLSTLSQDAAGTNPVTEAGQVVAQMHDKSGQGNRACQTSTGRKPILRSIVEVRI